MCPQVIYAYDTSWCTGSVNPTGRKPVFASVRVQALVLEGVSFVYWTYLESELVRVQRQLVWPKFVQKRPPQCFTFANDAWFGAYGYFVHTSSVCSDSPLSTSGAVQYRVFRDADTRRAFLCMRTPDGSMRPVGDPWGFIFSQCLWARCIYVLGRRKTGYLVGETRELPAYVTNNKQWQCEGKKFGLTNVLDTYGALWHLQVQFENVAHMWDQKTLSRVQVQHDRMGTLVETSAQTSDMYT